MAQRLQAVGPEAGAKAVKSAFSDTDVLAKFVKDFGVEARLQGIEKAEPGWTITINVPDGEPPETNDIASTASDRAPQVGIIYPGRRQQQSWRPGWSCLPGYTRSGYYLDRPGRFHPRRTILVTVMVGVPNETRCSAVGRPPETITIGAACAN